jgi:hypothetical protein
MNDRPSHSPESAPEDSQIEAKKRRDLILALTLALGFGATGAYMHLSEPTGQALDEEEQVAFQEKIKTQTLSAEEVKRYHLGFGRVVTDKGAERIYEAAKAHMEERTKLIESGDLIEILPGAHFDKKKIEAAAAKSEIARQVLVEGKNEPAYVRTVDGEIMLGMNNEPIIAAKPFADALTAANADMVHDGKGPLKIEDGFRSDVTTAIIKASAGDARATDMGSGFHGAGLAVDIWNMDVAEPYLTKHGVIGGCAGSMFGSDYGHASAGEMDQQNTGFIATCTLMSPEVRSVTEKGERITRDTRKKVGKVFGKIGGKIGRAWDRLKRD